MSSDPTQSPTPTSPSSRAWYDEAFGEDYLDRYAHRDDDEAEQAVSLVLRYAALPAGSRAFDLCCGAGRHVRFLRDHRLEVIGGDRSMELLRTAHNVCRCFVRLDMRYLPFADASFDLVTNFFTAFGYFANDAENFAVLDEVHRVLRPGGWFALDFLNAHTARQAVLDNPLQELDDPERGIHWIIRRRISPDGLRSIKIQEKMRGTTMMRTLREEVRLYSEQELRRALETRGFLIDEFFGDYDGEPFDRSTSPRALFLAQKL